MQLIDGKNTFKAIEEELKAEVATRRAKGLKVPHLAAVLVGSDGASETYVNAKVRDCKRIGYESTLIRLPESVSEEALLGHIDALNRNDDIDGFIVQLPLPEHISSQRIIENIDPAKDVDGFHPVSFGKMALGMDTFISATPNGILELLDRYGIETEGKHCVVLGRSSIVGLPMSILMGQRRSSGNCTVTLLHSKSQNVKAICKSADILIAALGKPEFIREDYVKEGAVVIDVGITRVPSNNSPRGYVLKGDVHFDEVADRCSYITPVPGGVGPMTRASLLLNTLKASRQKEELNN